MPCHVKCVLYRATRSEHVRRPRHGAAGGLPQTRPAGRHQGDGEPRRNRAEADVEAGGARRDPRAKTVRPKPRSKIAEAPALRTARFDLAVKPEVHRRLAALLPRAQRFPRHRPPCCCSASRQAHTCGLSPSPSPSPTLSPSLPRYVVPRRSFARLPSPPFVPSIHTPGHIAFGETRSD